jgi:predicted RNase H-like HicB family nuclease
MGTATPESASAQMAPAARYAMVIAWSDEDSAYLVRLPQWEAAGRVLGPMAHGSTYTEAATEGTIALDLLIGTAHDLGWELPALVPAPREQSARLEP